MFRSQHLQGAMLFLAEVILKTLTSSNFSLVFL